MSRISLLLVLVLHSGMLTGIPLVNEVRLLYQQAARDEKHCKKLIRLLEPCNESNPLLFGYKGVATMMMANYVFNPFSKLSQFKKGKKMLEKAIAADINNV